MSHKKFLTYLSASNFYVVAMNFREKEKGFWRIKKEQQDLNLTTLQQKGKY